MSTATFTGKPPYWVPPSSFRPEVRNSPDAAGERRGLAACGPRPSRPRCTGRPHWSRERTETATTKLYRGDLEALGRGVNRGEIWTVAGDVYAVKAASGGDHSG